MLKGGSLFVQVLLGHNILIDDISRDLEFFTHANKAGIFQTNLASKESKRMDYLLYSVGSINTEDPKAGIWKKHELDISLHWRIMHVRKKYVHYEDRNEA